MEIFTSKLGIILLLIGTIFFIFWGIRIPLALASFGFFTLFYYFYLTNLAIVLLFLQKSILIVFINVMYDALLLQQH